jgi:hypothetical protein
MRLGRRILRKLSLEQLQEALRLKPKLDAIERLTLERDRLLKSLVKVEKKLSKLDGESVTSRRGSGRPYRTEIVTRNRRRVLRNVYKVSAETRRKMSEAAKRRYATEKSGDAPAAALTRKRRPLSPETRQKMAEAARRRWAKVKETAPSAAE